MKQRLYSRIPIFDDRLALEVVLEDGVIVEAGFVPWQESLNSRAHHPVLDALAEYYRNPNKPWRVSLQAAGTDYQQRVWQELQRIPAGEVRTYGELAEILNSSPRAVGNACRANPIALIVPCHRVVAKGGLGGYAGYTEGEELWRKQRLLQHEGAL